MGEKRNELIAEYEALNMELGKKYLELNKIDSDGIDPDDDYVAGLRADICKLESSMDALMCEIGENCD